MKDEQKNDRYAVEDQTPKDLQDKLIVLILGQVKLVPQSSYKISAIEHTKYDPKCSDLFIKDPSLIVMFLKHNVSYFLQPWYQWHHTDEQKHKQWVEHISNGCVPAGCQLWTFFSCQVSLLEAQVDEYSCQVNEYEWSYQDTSNLDRFLSPVLHSIKIFWYLAFCWYVLGGLAYFECITDI